MFSDLAVTAASGALIELAAVALASLALTLVVEVPAAAIMGLRRGREVAAVVCVNLMTNPVVLWTIFATSNNFIAWGSSDNVALWTVFCVMEVAAVVVEWRLLTWALDKPSPQILRVSVVMNASSLVVGLAFTYGVPALLQKFGS